MDAPRPLLTQVRAKHFRSLGDLTLDLGPLTVLVGPNGAGKSNVVAVLRFLRDAATRGLRYAYGQQGGSPTIPQRGYAHTEMGVVWSGPLGRAHYGLALSAMTEALEKEREVLRLEGSRSYVIRIPGETTRGSADFAVLNRPRTDLSLLADGALDPLLPDPDAGKASALANCLYWHIANAGFYLAEPSRLRAPQREATISPLDESGSNLAAVIASIRDTVDGQTLDQALERLVDGAVGYHVEQAAGFLVTFIDYAGQGDGQQAKSDLGLESDGTVRMMAMLAALYQTPPRSLVVLEEPEAGLHPGVLPVLADLIKEVSTRTQVLITTHSPDLIDCFDPDVLRVVEKVDGETRVGPVRPAQREAVRRKLFSPGELMRMEGLQLDLG